MDGESAVLFSSLHGGLVWSANPSLLTLKVSTGIKPCRLRGFVIVGSAKPS